jgi:hypothetical protein
MGINVRTVNQTGIVIYIPGIGVCRFSDLKGQSWRKGENIYLAYEYLQLQSTNALKVYRLLL